MIKSFEQFINESVSWNQGGCLFLLGKAQKDGNKNLYLVRAKKISTLQRANIPAEMVNLYEDIYIVKEENGMLKASKIMYDTKSLKNVLGLSSLNVVLNQHKTPFWRNTVRETEMNKVLKDCYSQVKGIPNVKL